jgi:hypothetical protein
MSLLSYLRDKNQAQQHRRFRSDRNAVVVDWDRLAGLRANGKPRQDGGAPARLKIRLRKIPERTTTQ